MVDEDALLWVPTKNQWEDVATGRVVTAEALASGKASLDSFETIIQSGRRTGKRFTLDKLIEAQLDDFKFSSPTYSFNDAQMAFRAQHRVAMTTPSTLTFSTPTISTASTGGTEEPLYYENPEAEIKFSDSAVVRFRRMFDTEEHVLSPFSRNSYTARVEFLEEEATVTVALPQNAKGLRSKEQWLPAVVEYANMLVCLGEEAGALPDA